MASKRRIRKKSCEGKVRYYEFAVAHREALRLRKETGEDYHAYPCHFCRGQQKKAYHVGRRPQQKDLDGL